jgi:hypothetical protein
MLLHSRAEQCDSRTTSLRSTDGDRGGARPGPHGPVQSPDSVGSMIAPRGHSGRIGSPSLGADPDRSRADGSPSATMVATWLRRS